MHDDSYSNFFPYSQENLTRNKQHQLLYDAVKDKPYEEHVLRQFHMVENSLKNKMDAEVSLCDF